LKKIITIFFLLSFFISQTGYQFIFILQQYEAKEEVEKQMLAGLPDSCFEIIEQGPDIHWVEHGKEFYFRNNLYDVFKVKRSKGKTFLYCLNDEKEEKIVNSFAKAAKSSASDPNEKSGKQAAKFPGQVYTCSTIEALTLCNRSSQVKFCCLEPAVLCSVKEIIVPPPKPGFSSLTQALY
jgi:hypothetical protein